MCLSEPDDSVDVCKECGAVESLKDNVCQWCGHCKSCDSMSDTYDKYEPGRIFTCTPCKEDDDV